MQATPNSEVSRTTSANFAFQKRNQMRKHVLSMLFSRLTFLKIVCPVSVIKPRRARESSLCRNKGFILLLHCFQCIMFHVYFQNLSRGFQMYFVNLNVRTFKCKKYYLFFKILFFCVTKYLCIFFFISRITVLLIFQTTDFLVSRNTVLLVL